MQPLRLSGYRKAYGLRRALSILVCLLSWVSLLSSKSRKLQARDLIEFFIFCCLMKLSGIRLLWCSLSYIDSVEAMISDS